MKHLKKITISILFCFMTILVYAQNVNAIDTLDNKFFDCFKNGSTSIQCAKQIYIQQNRLMILRYNDLLKSCNKEQAENLKDEQLSFLQKLKRTKILYEVDEYRANSHFIKIRTTILFKKTNSNYSSANYKVKKYGYYMLGDTIKTVNQYINDKYTSELTVRQLIDDSSKFQIKLNYTERKPYYNHQALDTITVKNNRGKVFAGKNCEITFTFFNQGIKVTQSKDCKIKFKIFGYYRRVPDIFDDTLEEEDYGRE